MLAKKWARKILFSMECECCSTALTNGVLYNACSKQLVKSRFAVTISFMDTKNLAATTGYVRFLSNILHKPEAGYRNKLLNETVSFVA